MLLRHNILNAFCKLSLIAAMLLLAAPKELWHNHEHHHQQEEQAPSQEEDCALCDFHFSAFIFETHSFELSAPLFYQPTNTPSLSFTPTIALVAHSGLAPPSA